MRYFTPGHNLTSRITASLLIILYILTLGPLNEALAFVIPQNLLPTPISSSQITKFSSISGKYDQLCRYNPTSKKFEYFVLDNPEYSKFTTLEPAKGYQVNLSSECILRITGRIPNTNYSSSLLTGWQMLGYYSKNRVKVSDALANLVKGTNYDRISRYDTAANTFVDLASTDYLEPGVSYFIRVLKNSTWTILPKPDVIELAEFAYNADGSRVKKIVNGAATVYIDGLYEKTGSAITKHIFAGASRVCSVNTQTSSPANPQTYYYHPDHLGSSNVITNASGAQLQLEEYKPYGSLSRNEPANPQTGSPVHHYFTGKELDSTGLYYYGARYYDPKIGRFITPDPITQNLYDPQNLNAYTYVRNNPLNLIDHTGMAFDSFGGFGSTFSGDWSSSYTRSFDHSWSSPGYSSSWGYTQTGNTFSSFSSVSNGFNSFSYSSSMILSGGLSYQSANSIFNDWRASSAYRLGRAGWGQGTGLFAGISSSFARIYNSLKDTWTPTPERVLRWSGRVLQESNYKIGGRALSILGTAIDPGGVGKMTGMIAGGGLGALGGGAVGTIFLGPGYGTVMGKIGGGIIGGAIGGTIGTLFDWPYTGSLNVYDDRGDTDGIF